MSAASPPPPDLFHALTEPWRAGFEATRLALAFEDLVESAPPGDDHPVLVLPSYGTGDGGTTVLRRFLRRVGYRTPPSALGRNVDRGDLRIRRVEDAARFRSRQAERVLHRVRALADETGHAPSLVGWSMGGLLALDVSQHAPELVRSVVTLGSPFGDPRGTSMFHLMRRLSGSRVPVEEQDFSTWTERARLQTHAVPITVIHSNRDGIVGRAIARLAQAPCVRHVHVDSSHLGFAAHPEVYSEVAQALARTARTRAA
ncbi:MAG TPA: hypothetical protein PLW10_04955 [Myxococcota bacterium]|nr:hypothetical protein [Myxococcota bacterium]